MKIEKTYDANNRGHAYLDQISDLNTKDAFQCWLIYESVITDWCNYT